MSSRSWLGCNSSKNRNSLGRRGGAGKSLVCRTLLRSRVQAWVWLALLLLLWAFWVRKGIRALHRSTAGYSTFVAAEKVDGNPNSRSFVVAAAAADGNIAAAATVVLRVQPGHNRKGRSLEDHHNHQQSVLVHGLEDYYNRQQSVLVKELEDYYNRHLGGVLVTELEDRYNHQLGVPVKEPLVVLSYSGNSAWTLHTDCAEAEAEADEVKTMVSMADEVALMEPVEDTGWHTDQPLRTRDLVSMIVTEEKGRFFF